MKISLRIGMAFLLLAVSQGSAETLDIYFIDVEGGQATLLITPAKEALLIDAGWPGEGEWESKAGNPRKALHAQRITAVVKDAGLEKIDYLLITHFHRDHLGGVSELAQLLPIGTFFDYGSPLPDEEALDDLDAYAFETYRQTRARHRHVQPNVGDQLPLKNLEVVVVSSDRATLAESLPGAGNINSSCRSAAIEASDKYENPRSIGVLVQFGIFRFLDLGDLSGQPLFDLVCPRDNVGLIDVYLVPHHGAPDAADPATFAAFQPRAAIVNNGATKGAWAEVIRSLQDSKHVGDVWQLHRAERPSAENVDESEIANLSQQSTHWIKVTARTDGSFSVLNGRTGSSKHYGSRKPADPQTP